METQISQSRQEIIIDEGLATKLREQVSTNRNKYDSLGLRLIVKELKQESPVDENSFFRDIRDIYYFRDSVIEIFTDALTGATYTHFYCPKGKVYERKEQFKQLLSKL